MPDSGVFPSKAVAAFMRGVGFGGAATLLAGRAWALVCVPPPAWTLPSSDQGENEAVGAPPEVPPNVKLWRSSQDHAELFDAQGNPIQLTRLYSTAPDAAPSTCGVCAPPNACLGELCVDSEGYPVEEGNDPIEAGFFVYAPAGLAPGPHRYAAHPSAAVAFVVAGEPDLDAPAVPLVTGIGYDVHYEALELDDGDGAYTMLVDVVTARLSFEAVADVVVFRAVGSDEGPLQARALQPGYEFVGYDWCNGSAFEVEAGEAFEVELGAFDLAGNFSGWSAPVRLDFPELPAEPAFAADAGTPDAGPPLTSEEEAAPGEQSQGGDADSDPSEPTRAMDAGRHPDSTEARAQNDADTIDPSHDAGALGTNGSPRQNRADAGTLQTTPKIASEPGCGCRLTDRAARGTTGWLGWVGIGALVLLRRRYQ